MDLDNLRTVIEEAVSVSVREIRLHGIVDAAIRKADISSEEVQKVAAQLQLHGHGEIRISAQVELFLHVSNTELLNSVECTAFHIRVTADGNDLRAVARSDKNWAIAWARGIEPIKQAALQTMRRDVRTIAGDLAEDSYTFQAAMVLLATELVGPYVDRIATFLGYHSGLVQVIAARLYEAKIWESTEVRCESWFDPEKGDVAFALDLMVAEGKLIRTWSEQNKEYEFSEPDVSAVSHLGV